MAQAMTTLTVVVVVKLRNRLFSPKWYNRGWTSSKQTSLLPLKTLHEVLNAGSLQILP